MIRFRNISLLVFAAALIIPMACETERKIFEGPYFVRFTDATLIEKESHSPIIEVQVHNGGPAPKGDVVINYSISGTAREGIDYQILGTRGRVRIKSGEYFGTVQVKLINNSNDILGSQDLVLTLVTIQNGTSQQIGQGVSQIGRVFTLTIQDDCVLGGDYYGVEEEGDTPIEDITITSPTCAVYTLSNWDMNPYNLFPADLTFTDNGDNTLTVPLQKETSIHADSAFLDGSGVVDPATRRLSFEIRTMFRGDTIPYTFLLIPN